MAVHTLKRNDTAPAFTSTLTDSAGVAVDVSGSTILFKMTNMADNVAKVNSAADIVSGPAGTVSYQQTAADVNTAGVFLVEWEVTYSDGRVQTFPTVYHNIVVIHGDLS